MMNDMRGQLIFKLSLFMLYGVWCGDQIHLFIYSIVKFIKFGISYVKCTNVNVF